LLVLAGDAGTGKTHVAAAWASQMIRVSKSHKLVYVRSPLEAGRASIGFIPGTVDEKMAPYTAHLFTIATKVGLSLKAIEVDPTCLIQGKTFENCTVLLDEAQNLTIDEFRAVVTRVGKDSTLIIAGDPEQDTRRSGGLPIFINRTQHLDCVRVIRFDAVQDNMRHPMLIDVLGALRGA
jgi:phosphate starvation-inducible PhoH-like protein